MLTSYFCFPTRGDALDAMNDVHSVLGMVNAFLGARDPLDAFGGNETAVCGLSVVLSSAMNSLAVTQAELRETLRDKGKIRPVPEVELDTEEERAAWKEGYLTASIEARLKTTLSSSENVKPETGREEALAKRLQTILSAASVPVSEEDASDGNAVVAEKPAALSAREAAVLETYRKGYEIEAIAQAVNLKKTSVQRIIARLKATGDIPQDRGGECQAASA